MLGYSIALNVALVVALVIVYFRAMVKAKEHKLATFAGCLGALTCGAMHDDPEDRMKLLALGFGPMLDAETDEIRKQLIRASMFHMLRGTQNPSLFDVGGDNTRLLAIQAGAFVGSVGETDEIWDYIEAVSEDKANYRGEVSDIFTDSALGRAQLYVSSLLLGFYKAHLDKLTVSPV